MDQPNLQLGLDFSRPASAPDGVSQWHRERQEAVVRLAKASGLPLGHSVETCLRDGTVLRGTLRLAEDSLFTESHATPRLLLKVDRCTFTPAEIESCVRLDCPPSGA